MSITVYTHTPRKLIRLIKEGIESGDITTWSMDDDGDFTHSPTQWKNKAWMAVAQYIPSESIVFGIIGRKYTELTPTEYAVYHGRFVEMLLSHFEALISDIHISAHPTQYDR